VSTLNARESRDIVKLTVIRMTVLCVLLTLSFSVVRNQEMSDDNKHRDIGIPRYCLLDVKVGLCLYVFAFGFMYKKIKQMLQ